MSFKNINEIKKMPRITSIKKLLHTQVCDKIELITNTKRKILFDYMFTSDSVDNIFCELQAELKLIFENDEIVRKDLQTLIQSNRIRSILYD